MAAADPKYYRMTYKNNVLELTTDRPAKNSLEVLLFMVIHEYHKRNPDKCDAFIQRVNLDWERVKNRDKPKAADMEEIEEGFDFFNYLMQLGPRSY